MSITVGVCVRNGERFIEQCLSALLAQTHPPQEIIVVNDHSTDGTARIVQGVAGQAEVNIRLLENKGRGLYDGRNTVLRHTQSEFLAFTDADCVVDKYWLERILGVFAVHPEVVAGTGAHPPIGPQNWVSEMHKLWFIVEGTTGKGYTDGVVGANSYFRRAVLDEVGGWISLPFGNAEDVYISLRIAERGYKIWFDEDIKVYHHYTTDFKDFLRKTYNSGYAITRMMLEAGLKGPLYRFTLGIPLGALTFLTGVLFAFLHRLRWVGIALIGLALLATFALNLRRFGSVKTTLPRWLVRWVIIWGYSLGVVRALLASSHLK